MEGTGRGFWHGGRLKRHAVCSIPVDATPWPAMNHTEPLPRPDHEAPTVPAPAHELPGLPPDDPIPPEMSPDPLTPPPQAPRPER